MLITGSTEARYVPAGVAGKMVRRVVEEQEAWQEQMRVAMERGNELRREYVRGGADMLSYLLDVLLSMVPNNR